MKKLVNALLLGLLLSPCHGLAADAEYSYMGNGGSSALAYHPLDIVRAEEAYRSGYTGQGITVGVWDTPVNFAHPEFAGKESSASVSSAEVRQNFSDNTFPAGSKEYWELINHHGSHVSGIIAAAKDGQGMHGVAYEAEVLHSCYGFNGMSDGDITGLLWQEFTCPEQKLINASFKFSGENSFGAEREQNMQSFVKSMQQLGEDKLLVVAAANDGKLKPTAENTAWRYDSSLKNSFISVLALHDNVCRVGETIRTTDGKQPVAPYSNLALGAEEYSLLAPGSKLYSLRAASTVDGGDRYLSESGTSMATPVVTGVGALVQQAYPYLTAKQLGDVLLSTANRQIEAGKYYTNADRAGVRYIYYYEAAPDYRQIMEDTGIFQQADYGDEDFNVYVFSNVPREVLLGQGVVDAAKAVKGLGSLNARRLTAADKSSSYTIGGITADQALYHVNTQGYDSVWSNDINEIKAGYLAADSTEADLKERYDFYQSSGEKIKYFSNDGSWDYEDAPIAIGDEKAYRADKEAISCKDYLKGDYIEQIIAAYNKYVTDSGLAGLHVGLKKEGGGTLVLGGNNTYQGSTIVSDGTLAVDGSLAGDAHSEGAGLLTGAGVIKGSLYNTGTVRGGTQDISLLNTGNNVLSVQGDLHSTGKLLLAANGNVQSYLDVMGAVDLAGSTLAIDGSSNFLADYAYSTNIVRQNGNELVNDWQEKEAWQNTMLHTVYDDAGHTVTMALKEQLDSVPASAQEAFTGVKALYAALPAEGKAQMMPLFKLDSSSAAEALQDIKGELPYSAVNTAVQNSNLLTQVVSARLNQATAMERMKVAVGGSMLVDAGAPGGTEITMPLTMNHSDGFWLKFSKSWSSIGGSANLHSSALTAGYDRQVGSKWRLGMLYSRLTGSAGAESASSSSRDNRIGLYGGYACKAHSAFLLADYGKADNDMHRVIRHLGANSASYDSHSFALSGEYKYDLDYHTEKSWHLSPYLNGQLAWYKQAAYTEAGDYARHIHALHNTYTALGLGLELRREYANGTALSLRLGGKHAFSGVNPRTRFNYAGDAAHAYTNTPGQDSSLWTASVNGEMDLGSRWTCTGELGLEKGSNDRNLIFGLTLRKVW